MNAVSPTSSHATQLHQQAIQAWQRGERNKGLQLLQQAKALAPGQWAIEADLARAELGVGWADTAFQHAAWLSTVHPASQSLMQELTHAYQAIRRPPALAGSFYAAQPKVLAASIDAWLAADATETARHPACPKVLVLPHAGHVYSGAMAARGWALMRPHRQRIRKIVLLGPTHRMAVAGFALPGVGSFATPLGNVVVDALAIQAIADIPGVQTVPQAHAQEHDLEVHLPFIQRVWDGLPLPTIVPILVGSVPHTALLPLLQRLWGGDDTLIIVSTDLSHYHPYAKAATIDQATCMQILAKSTTLNHQQACGATPLNAVLQWAQQHQLQIERIGYCNSGDTAGNTPQGREKVVGYASFTLYETIHSQANTSGLSPNDGQRLLAQAKASLYQAVGLSNSSDLPVRLDALQEPGASFVTLTHHGQLRGCIGSLQAQRPLDEDVWSNAASAALRDPRFPPVNAELAPQLDVEVSVLSAPAPLLFANQAHALWQLQPHVHGVIFETEYQGQRWRSTFLPQVWEQIPDPRCFMAQLKRKAGLPADHWSPQVRLQVYTVQKFREGHVA